MSNGKTGFRPVYAAVLIATLLLLGLTVWLLLGFTGSGGGEAEYVPAGSVSLRNTERLEWNGSSYVPKNGLETILLIGVDAGEGRTVSEGLGGQADVLLLLVLDHSERTYRILQINRDTVTQVPVLSGNEITGEIMAPICLSHGYGDGGLNSCENTVRAVRYLLSGVKIDGYAAVDMEAIGELNDAVGGVTVVLDKDLTVVNPAFREGATVHLDAESAEDYLRARMAAGEADNLSRMSRHRRYMEAWLETAKAQTGGSGAGAVKLLEKLEPLLVTDMTEKHMSALAEDAFRFEDGGIVTIDGVNESNGSFNCFYPDEDSLREVQFALFYEKEETE